MSNVKKITAPINKAAIEDLRAGDEVLITGTIYTARDIAHKRLCESISRNEPLPFDIEDAVIYFVGPSPAPQGRAIGSAGPTTSSRMDPFSPILLEHGLAAMIGKGLRGQKVIDSLKKNKGVHFSAIGGAGALLSKAIKASEIVAYEDLGTEAIRKLTVVDFPVVVAYDSYGNTVYNASLQ
ncbi:MAG: Fe-S-containing hydro-lyase [Sedimentisphaeraceae bacterium JB056]